MRKNTTYPMGNEEVGEDGEKMGEAPRHVDGPLLESTRCRNIKHHSTTCVVIRILKLKSKA